ncbi:MAG TPA: glycine betaine ABC transporter substrate-binding protein [Burkholderiales bacterium]|nr:glycine betaine ABC transporter substrate-binding protein [Burkholderiales bacterium]
MRRAILTVALLLPALAGAAGIIHVGSKRFTESYILGEIVAQTVRSAGEAEAVHHQGLGNTGVLFAALKSGAIDLYPEYTGTIAVELLRQSPTSSLAELNRGLAAAGLAASIPLGFSNSYALAMNEREAAALGVRTIADLRRHPQLRLGLTQEFLNRKDGWPALRAAYGLPFVPRGLDHGLAYEALSAGQIEVVDVYTTDAKIERYGLRVLMDDRHFFPAYAAVLLHRRDLPGRFPGSWQALQKLEGRLSESQMIALNAQAELHGVPFAAVAEGFLTGTAAGVGRIREAQRSFWRLLLGADFLRLTGEHLLLVLVSLAFSIAIGVPLGVWCARSVTAARWILSATGIAQTIPSLALLAFLITLTGSIGVLPALVALLLYGLLPIVRNTASGLADIAPPLRESAAALGLSSWTRLREIELPLAARAILAGIKTSAVINVGTATIAALIGAGGYGERIVAGLAVHDNALLLAGAVPAALLALAAQWGFDLVDRWLIPAGLRPDAARERGGR